MPGDLYARAISSAHWFNLKDEARRRSGGICEGLRPVLDDDGRVALERVGSLKPYRGEWRVVTRKCTNRGVQLHHLHYGTVGRESAADVRLLCDWCHMLATALAVRVRCDQNWGDGGGRCPNRMRLPYEAAVRSVVEHAADLARGSLPVPGYTVASRARDEIANGSTVGGDVDDESGDGDPAVAFYHQGWCLECWSMDEEFGRVAWRERDR